MNAYAKTCEETLPITANNLSGTWVDEKPNIKMVITHELNNEFYGSIKQNDRIVWSYAGTWELVGNTLYYTYTKSSLSRIPVGTKNKDVIINIGCGYKTFYEESGKVNRFRKIGNAST